MLTTCANPEEADELAAALIEERLAACVNRVDGITSTYRWESELKRDRETLVLIKTTEERFDELEIAIRDHTSYELPELIAVPVCRGSAAYLDWVEAAVTR